MKTIKVLNEKNEISFEEFNKLFADKTVIEHNIYFKDLYPVFENSNRFKEFEGFEIPSDKKYTLPEQAVVLYKYDNITVPSIHYPIFDDYIKQFSYFDTSKEPLISIYTGIIDGYTIRSRIDHAEEKEIICNIKKYVESQLSKEDLSTLTELFEEIIERENIEKAANRNRIIEETKIKLLADDDFKTAMGVNEQKLYVKKNYEELDSNIMDQTERKVILQDIINSKKSSEKTNKK